MGAQLCRVSTPGTPALEEPLVSQQRPPQQVGLVRGQVLAVEASVVIIIIVSETLGLGMTDSILLNVKQTGSNVNVYDKG